MSSVLCVPNAVEYVAIGVDPDVEVGLDDVVELAGFFVPEKSVRHPDLVQDGKMINGACTEPPHTHSHMAKPGPFPPLPRPPPSPQEKPWRRMEKRTK
jgi:hypothetical protein